MVQSNDVVNLVTYLDEWTRCIGSGYQKDSLYRFGKFGESTNPPRPLIPSRAVVSSGERPKKSRIADACSAQWRDVGKALRAKAKSDPDEARKLIAETHYRRNLGSDLTQSPTAGVIWELKETPGWDEVDE